MPRKYLINYGYDIIELVIKMRYPEFLKDGGTIGLFAPSFGANIDPYKMRLEHAIKKFESMGYKIKQSPHIFTYHFGASAKKELRAKCFMDMYLDEEIDVLWSVGGGEWMMEMIPLIDFELLKKAKPKFVIGYSDNTNLTFLMNTLLDTVSIYGQNFTEFGMTEWDPSLIEALEVIKGSRNTQHKYLKHESKIQPDKDPLASYTLTEETPWQSLHKESFHNISGRLIGGCLDVLTIYPGLKLDQVQAFNERYKTDGIIWFLEACDLNLFGIKRALWQLNEAGWFKHLKGIVFGRPLNGEPLIDITHEQVLKDLFNDLGVPIFYDLDFGHIAPTFTILSGAKANITFNEGNGFITYVKP